MFEAIFKGVFLGFGLSLMTGTTFVALFNIALYKGFKPAILFTFGVFISDLTIFLAVFLGFANFYQDPKIRSVFSILGGILILLYGIRLLIKPEVKQNHENNIQSLWSYAIKGIVINLLNPLVFVFWLGISTVISQTSKPLFTSISALLTMLIVDIFKSYFISKFGNNIKPQLIHWLNIISASILILIGLRLLFM
jgi:threonine/homoserine/homoserine lactone efflux protein